MANYLVPAGNAAPISTQTRSRADIMSVNDMHRMKIYNKKGTIAFSGFIPPDFNISLSSNWETPFANSSMADVAGMFGGNQVGGAATDIQRAGKFMGFSGMNKLLSAQVWSTPSYLMLDLPIFVDAYTDTKSEVIDSIVQMLSLVAPEEEPNTHFLLPPGPTPAKQIFSEMGAGQGPNAIPDEEAFIVDIGKFLSVSPCVVKNVVTSLESTLEDGTGNPMACDFILQVSSYFAVSRQDIRKWFKTTSTPGV